MATDTPMPDMEHNHDDHDHGSTTPHPDDPIKLGEHEALLNLVPESQATHKAVKSGSWFDAQTWANGRIPSNGARVSIPEGFTVTYDAESDARLKTVRVDGTLKFARDRDTKILLDTFVVAPEGTLDMGTAADPIQANKTARTIFTSNKPIDTNWDPKQLSRGLISHGKARIYGADKLDFVALEGNALKGSNELVLKLPKGAGVPKGWQVGDQLVLGGTQYQSWRSNADNSRFQDEVLTITEIEGNRIRFTNNDIASGNNSVLRFDHKRPAGFENKLQLYIANTSRNVTFETENGKAAPTQQRGHVMFMHNPDVVVQNAGFYNLGRTDKNKLIDDVGQNVDGSKGYGTNQRGRYALHLHRTGANDINGTPAIAKGNAIVGSPGWGIVHHDSNAVLEDNVVFDVVGAGIVAEAGNELGAWRNNITIKTTGDSSTAMDLGPETARSARFDFGFNGEGYWVQGAAQIEIDKNIAISATGAGINLFGGADGGAEVREKKNISIANLPVNFKSIAQGMPDESVVDVSVVPLLKFTEFECYNSRFGIQNWARMMDGDGQLDFGIRGDNNRGPAHNFRSKIKDFKLWNIYITGVDLVYSSNVDLENGLILSEATNKAATGVSVNNASMEQKFKNLHIEGFQNGLRVPIDADKQFLGSLLENSHFSNNKRHLELMLSLPGKIVDFPNFFQIESGNTFEVDGSNINPSARFNTRATGGLAVEFDAASSFDIDSPLKEQASKGIVSYGWDFDNNGKIDAYGRRVSHYFDKLGSHDVALTVWDNQGATTRLTKTINVKPKQYLNPLLNSDFSSDNVFASASQGNSSFANRGWFATQGVIRDSNIGNGGSATLSGKYKSGIGQILQDDSIRRGKQSLSLDIKNTEGNLNKLQLNEIKVNLWGIDGEFYNDSLNLKGPSQAGVLPFNAKKLLEETVGGSSFDWKTFKWDVNVGQGFQFLLLRIDANRANNTGDFIAIDNVKLIGDGTPVLSSNPAPNPSIPIPTNSEPMGSKEIRIEAESMDLKNFRIGANDSASGGKLLTLKHGADRETGTASFDFAGISGKYNVVVGYYDETDGAGQMKIQHEQTVLDAWSLDRQLGSAAPDAKSLTSRMVAQGLTLETGDTFALTGTEVGGEYGRIDYVKFVHLE